MPGGARRSSDECKPKIPKIVQCYHCNYSTKIKCNLQKHIVNVHVLKKGASREKPFVCPMCSCITTRVKMVKHYSSVHGVVMNKSCHNFLNMEDFAAWKTKTERDEKARYIVLKGVTKLKSCNVKYYRCHRDGFFHSKGTGKRTLKTKGTNKINGCCPSEMKVMEDQATGRVQVHFVNNHVGHALEVDRLPLLKEDRDRIAEKLAQNVPLSKVLDEVHKNNNGEASERIHLLTRKDVLNIASLYKLKNESARKSIEGVSEAVDVWVKKIFSETPVIRFYKPQGETSPSFSELSKTDFVLIVFNDVQIEFLKFYGREFVCFDRTHSRSGRDFELTTVLVIDELQQGFPCAFMLSNRSDAEMMSIFMSVLRYYCDRIDCKFFMSDVTDVYYNAWRTEMGTPGFRAFSSWHVDRAWRKTLNKIKTPSKRAYAYKIVKTLTRVHDLDSFERVLYPAITDLKDDPEILPFGEFFEKEYATNYTCWANCFRANSNVATNINRNLESMHKTIKNVFLQGKKAKRLDKPIAELMKLVREKLFEQSIVAHKNHLPEDLMFVKKAHETYLMSFNGELSIEKTENGWRVNHLLLDNTFYDVVANNLSCPCHIRCEICQVCLHSYKCTCPDYAIKWNVCVHVHITALYIDSKVACSEFEEESKVSEVQVMTEPQTVVMNHQDHLTHQPVNHLTHDIVQVQAVHQGHTVVHHIQPVHQSQDIHQCSDIVHHPPPIVLQAQLQSTNVVHQPQSVVHPSHESPTLIHQAQAVHTPHSIHQSHSAQQSQPQSIVEEEQVHQQGSITHRQHGQSRIKDLSDGEDDRSMEVLQICDSNVPQDLEDLIFKQLTKPVDGDLDLRQAKNDALKLVQDIFDTVETKAQLEVFTNAILPVIPTITAMKYSDSCYK